MSRGIMENEDSEKLAIINEIIRLESSTNDALRSSRDEIERLEIITSQKKDTVRELEEELNALLESKKKKKKRSLLRPKGALRRMTISGYEGGEGPPNHAMFRRGSDNPKNLAMQMSTGLSDSKSMARSMGEVEDDVASTTFTVGTSFGSEDIEIGSLWNQPGDGDGDASTFCGGGSVISHGNSHLGSNYAPLMMTEEVISQKQTLLAEKQAEIKQSQQKYDLNAKKLLQMQQHLSILQRQQNSQCEEYNANIDSLAQTKTDIIARIRWREARILEEEKKLAELRKRMAEAKGSTLPQCRKKHSTKSNSNIDELTALTEKCADVLTEFSSSIFKMIESTITLPPHSSVSYSIGLSSEDASSIDTGTTGNDPSSNNRTKQNQLLKGKPGSSRTPHNEEGKDEADEQKLNELQKSQDQYDAKIRMIRNEIKSFLSAHKEETKSNNAILADLQKQVSIFNDQLMKGGNEIKELVSELESLNEKERDLLQFIHVPEAGDE